MAALLVAAAAGLAVPPAGAGDNADHERALAAVRAGEVLPLPVLLERLQRSHPGQVLELELDRSDGRWRYEIKLLEPGGRVVKLDVDARTALVLQRRNKGGRHAPRERALR